MPSPTISVRTDPLALTHQGLHEVLNSPSSAGNSPRGSASDSSDCAAAAATVSNDSKPPAAATVSPLASALSAFSFGLLGSPSSSAKLETTATAGVGKGGADGVSSRSSSNGGSVAADIDNAAPGGGGGSSAGGEKAKE